MTKMRLLSAVSLLVCALFQTLGAQNRSGGQDAHLGSAYSGGGKHKVIVLAMNFPGGDSVRAILQRDFKYGDRIEVLANTERLQFGSGGAEEFALFAQLQARSVVRGVPTSGGVILEHYEVASKKLTRTRDFALPADRASAAWRYAVHDASDRVEEWITGQRGIAHTRIAFVRNETLYLIDSDGANEQVFARGQMLMSPAWHPSGDMIAFSALQGNVHQIGVKPLGGNSQVRWLTSDRSGANSAPTFSPSGSEIFWSWHNNRSANIRAMPTSGNGPRRPITNDALGENSSPALSPDGRMAIATNRLGNVHIYVMGIDGTGARQLIPFVSGTRSYISDPAWAPDGSKIAFSSRGENGYFQIELVAVNSQVPTLKTSVGSENTDPAWAPDSRHIVFTSTRTGRNELWILDTETGSLRQLTHGGGKLAAWSPNLGREP